MKKEKRGPAALLAESLLNAADNDLRGFGVRSTDLVLRIVSFGISQIHVAFLHLAPRRLCSSLVRAPTTTGSDSPGSGGGRSGGILEVDFAAELEERRGVRWGRGARVDETHFHD